MKQASLFIVLLKYSAPLDRIDAFRKRHMEFLDKFYSQNTFIASGPQSPRSGGIIIAKAYSKTEMQEIIQQDPFVVNNLATLDIIEFTATKFSDLFSQILDSKLI